MNTTIYTTAEAMETLEAIKGLSWSDRTGEHSDLASKQGYTLKQDLNLSVLPDGASIGLSINTKLIDYYVSHVEFPANLRGCIFEGAPNLPPKYVENIEYWSHEVKTPEDTNTVYFQNPDNAYMVQLVEDEEGENHVPERFVSEGIVVHIKELKDLIDTHGLQPEQFIEIGLPVDREVFGNEDGDTSLYDTGHEYKVDVAEGIEVIYLKVDDVLKSPDPNNIYIDVLRHEMLDYGYYY
jgi:hypothetical protein